MLEYHHDWVRNSNVPEKSAVCREHKFLLEVLRMLIEYDQIDPTCLGGVELLVRRIYQLEIAVDRNPKHPEFDGLEAPVETSTKSTGSATLPTLANWFCVLRNSRALVLGQMSLWSDKQKGQGVEK